jgi:hypothetical protein
MIIVKSKISSSEIPPSFKALKDPAIIDDSTLNIKN